MRQPTQGGAGDVRAPAGGNRDKRVKNMPPEKATDFSLFWHILNCRKKPGIPAPTPGAGLARPAGGRGGEEPPHQASDLLLRTELPFQVELGSATASPTAIAALQQPPPLKRATGSATANARGGEEPPHQSSDLASAESPPRNTNSLIRCRRWRGRQVVLRCGGAGYIWRRGRYGKGNRL